MVTRSFHLSIRISIISHTTHEIIVERAAKCHLTAVRLRHAVLNHLRLHVHPRGRHRVLHIILWGHRLLLVMLLLHLFVVGKVSSRTQTFLFLGRLLDKVFLAQQSRTVKSVSKLALELFPVKNIPNFISHNSIGLEEVLPLCKRENT